MSEYHVPVMVEEVLACLEPERGGVFVDGTLGGGGHAEALLEAGADVRLIGVDRDPEALEAAEARLERFGDRAVLVRGNYGDLPWLLEELGEGPVDGLLIDAGVSSHQLDTPERGFSFQAEGPLDMRMGPEAETVDALLGRLLEGELADVLYQYGEVRGSRRLARRIKEAHEQGELETTLDLADLCGKPRRRDRIHPATQVFQALRIAANDELGALERAVENVEAVLAPEGRCAFISFHSLEDRIVKRGLRALEQSCICPQGLPVCVCDREPIVETVGGLRRPSEAEVERNPRARSARLRCARRLETG